MRKLSVFPQLFFIDSKSTERYLLPIVMEWFKRNSVKVLLCQVFLPFMMLTTAINAQTNYITPSHYTPPTPEAAKFEKYINYPVNHSTGAASVDIPLYTLKVGAISIPISLSYHTSGVKPGDPSIPVGLGWVLNPGARVTRKILSYPDELYDRAPFQASYDPVTDLIALENMEYSPSFFWPSTNRTAILDAEYDIFTYNTPTGASGRFIIQKQGSEYIAVPLSLTSDKIKIHIGISALIDYIEITDANGYLYRYGKGLTTYSSNPESVTNEGTSAASTGWLLTDIVPPDQTEPISFIWKNLRNNDVYNWYRKNVVTDYINLRDGLTGFITHPEYLPSVGYSDDETLVPQYTESLFIMTALGGIKFKDEEVKMIYTSTIPTILGSMEVYSNGIKREQVDFQTSNFANNYKKLTGVSFKDQNGQIVSQYQFGYNELVQLPDEFSRAIDFWGYYNGASNTTLIPNFPYQVIRSTQGGTNVYNWNTNTDRSSNSNAAAYILNSVTYPTGGKTTFEYEINQFSSGPTVVPSGGLRVKKISHWSSDGQLAELRTYKYGISECGYGDGYTLTDKLFVDETLSCSLIDVGPGGPGNRIIYRQRIITGSLANPMFLSEMPPVSYQEVTEYIGDNSINSGKTIYRYSPRVYPVNSTVLALNQYSYVDNYFQEPVLLSKSSYKNNAGTYSIVSKESTDYIEYEPETIHEWAIRRYGAISSTLTGHSPQFVELYFTAEIGWGYLPTVFKYYPVSLRRGIRVPGTVRNITYSPVGTSIETTKVYGYTNNDYLFPRTLTTTNSDGTTSITNYTYPKDYNTGGSPANAVAQGIKLLIDRNVVAPVVEEYTTVQPDNIVRSGKFTTFKTTVPEPDQTYELRPITTPNSFTPATITSSASTKSSSYDLKSTINLYDAFGNVRQATDEAKGMSTVILYSYNGRFPIAVIENSNFANVAAAISGGQTAIDNFAAGYPDNSQVNTFLSTLRTSLPQAFVTTYTVDPYLGITTQTDPNGRTVTYQYDPAGQLQLIKDKDGNVVKTFEYKYRQ